MNNINIQSDETIKVEINQTGYFIELNPLDVGFPLKLDEAYAKIGKKEDILKQEWHVIDKQPDRKEGLLSVNQRAKIEKYRDYNNECGKIVDELFGEGTNKAAFNGKNYFGMYNDLFISLTPFIKEVYGDPNAVIDRIKTKYAKEDSDTLK